MILKNLIGWTLLLVAFVAGPLVPGPGGIPLFLIGFALISFPGKRRLSARVLRGRRLDLRGRTLRFGVLWISLVVPALAIGFFRSRLDFLPSALKHGFGLVAAYVLCVAAMGLLGYGFGLATNLVLRAMPLIRRRIRPWLRRHHIRLLPPRYRRRLSHEQGTGPVRLKGEIITYLRKRHRPPHGSR